MLPPRLSLYTLQHILTASAHAAIQEHPTAGRGSAGICIRGMQKAMDFATLTCARATVHNTEAWILQIHVALALQRSEVVSILQCMTSSSEAPQGLPHVCWRFARRACLRRSRNKGQSRRQEHLWHTKYLGAGFLQASCA